MSEDEKREFPHWEELYQEQEIESMPWFNLELDEDLENALDEMDCNAGARSTSVPDPELRRWNSPAEDSL